MKKRFWDKSIANDLGLVHNGSFRTLYENEHEARKLLMKELDGLFHQYFQETSHVLSLPEDIDVVIGNGGFSTVYFLGVAFVLQEIRMRYDKLIVRRCAGSCFGALMAYFYQQNLHHSKVNNFYFAWNACRSAGEYEVKDEHWSHIVDDAVTMGGLPFVNSVHIVNTSPDLETNTNSIFRTSSSLKRTLLKINHDETTAPADFPAFEAKYRPVLKVDFRSLDIPRAEEGHTEIFDLAKQGLLDFCDIICDGKETSGCLTLDQEGAPERLFTQTEKPRTPKKCVY